MPPKGGNKRKAASAVTTGVNSEAASAPQTPTLAESLSYLHSPRPFKNPNYTKNVNRRTKNLKTVLTNERERERAERERKRAEREEAMEVDGAANGETPKVEDEEEVPTYTSIEAPPSILPPKRYCDITGLEAPYTDPATGLRYHDKSIYELIKGLYRERVSICAWCKSDCEMKGIVSGDAISNSPQVALHHNIKERSSGFFL